jgi:hypothetical protein
MSSTTPSYSSRSMNPSRGLKTPVEIICRSDRARAFNGTLGSSAASIDRSLRSSSGITRSTRSPPCGAMALSVLSKILSLSSFSVPPRAVRRGTDGIAYAASS